ncbi:MAG: hypothetical protein WC406_05890 [Methanoregula sp.]
MNAVNPETVVNNPETIPEPASQTTANVITLSSPDAWLDLARQYDQFCQTNNREKKLAIVGFAPTRDLAPYYDETWDIWGLNDLHNQIPRYSRWFDIHTVENIETDVVADRTTAMARKCQVNEAAIEKMGISGLSKLNCPVYMQERNEKVPWSVRYPLTEMLAFWEKRGLTGSRYLTNSISYMVAYALFEGAVTGHQWTQINIYGVDMAVGDEYIAQRPSCEYWIGIAEGMGVKVFIPNASDLCKTTFLYAWEVSRQKAYEDKLNQIQKDAMTRLSALSQQQAEIARLINHAEAHIGIVGDMKKVWSNLDTKVGPPPA